MKRAGAILCAVFLCITILTACGNRNQTPPDETPPPPATEQAPSTEKNEEKLPTDNSDSAEGPVSIDHLTMELVVEWEEGDRLLSELESLSRLLKDSLLTQGYQVDEVTITISTAGGFTADALSNGGVDLAFLPAVEYITCSDTVTAVLTTDEELCTTVVAVNSQREELDAVFCTALTQAMLETDSGAAFLDTYQPGITCVPASEEAIQAVRDWVAEQEKEN